MGDDDRGSPPKFKSAIQGKEHEKEQTWRGILTMNMIRRCIEALFI